MRCSKSRHDELSGKRMSDLSLKELGAIVRHPPLLGVNHKSLIGAWAW
jgi:hypothetical protein